MSAIRLSLSPSIKVFFPCHAETFYSDNNQIPISHNFIFFLINTAFLILASDSHDLKPLHSALGLKSSLVLFKVVVPLYKLYLLFLVFILLLWTNA